MQVKNNPFDLNLTKKIEETLGEKISSVTSLGGGCVADVKRVVLENGLELVAKVSPTGKDKLDVEGFMLKYLAENTNLPTCKVYYCDKQLLLLEYILVNGSGGGKNFERSCARALAELHKISSDNYGFECDTVVGGLVQPNKQNHNWVDFFAQNRLLYMAKQAFDSGSLPLSVYKKIEKFAPKLGKYIHQPPKPSLIHGDVWTGNVLYKNDELAAFIDPAIYFADNEMEFTFATVWSSFGDDFFDAYNEITPIRPEFFEARRHIYNLYPLLVHTKLFGTSYAFAVDSCVSRFL